jgi:hypothetical protein
LRPGPAGIFIPSLCSDRHFRIVSLRADRYLPPDAIFQEASMLDLFMLLTGAGLFVLTIGYAYTCERI